MSAEVQKAIEDLTLAALQRGPTALAQLGREIRAIGQAMIDRAADMPQNWECHCRECGRAFLVARSSREERAFGLPYDCPPCFTARTGRASEIVWRYAEK